MITKAFRAKRTGTLMKIAIRRNNADYHLKRPEQLQRVLIYLYHTLFLNKAFVEVFDNKVFERVTIKKTITGLKALKVKDKIAY